MIDLAQEHADHVFGAQYDDVRERYSAEIEDMRLEGLRDDDHNNYMQTVYDAGFGDDDEAYEVSWKRAIDYYEDIQRPQQVDDQYKQADAAQERLDKFNKDNPVDNLQDLM